MSANIALFKNKAALPGYLKQAQMDDATLALMGSAGGGKRISIKGGVFRMLDNGKELAVNEDRAMNIIVLKAAPHIGRTYYAEKFVEGADVSPTCWSVDGVKPSQKSTQAQHTTCEGCAQNISGSGENGSRSCRYSQKLAVVLDGDVEGEIYSLSLPATSVFGKTENGKMPLQAYARFLASHNVPITSVVTEMRFDVSAAVPTLHFAAVRPLEEAEWATCVERRDSEDAVRAAEFAFSAKIEGSKNAPKQATPTASASVEEVTDEDEEAPAPVTAKSAAKPARKPAAKAEPVPVAEPTKVATPKKEAPAAPPSDVQNLLDEWAE